MQSNSFELTQGQVVGGRFRLESPLGEGGMGSVWRAEHLTLRSPVAVKLINPAISNSEEALVRFMREAQSAAALRSSHVVQIFDYGIDRGVPYIAMELLQGETLRQRLDRTRVLAPLAVGRIMSDAAKAIGKAHEAGIIHRDMKPDNIFLAQEGEDEVVKVLDFGIAKVSSTMGWTTTGARHTRTGAVLGTPYYMSPEQAQGSKVVDWRSDLWSMAIIAFECMTGQLPFESEGLGELIIKICVDPIPVPSDLAPVPIGFDEWFAVAANRDPGQRFQSAREMMDALKRILTTSTGYVSWSGLEHGPVPPVAADGSASLGSSQPAHTPPPSNSDCGKSRAPMAPSYTSQQAASFANSAGEQRVESLTPSVAPQASAADGQAAPSLPPSTVAEQLNQASSTTTALAVRRPALATLTTNGMAAAESTALSRSRKSRTGAIIGAIAGVMALLGVAAAWIARLGPGAGGGSSASSGFSGPTMTVDSATNVQALPQDSLSAAPIPGIPTAKTPESMPSVSASGAASAKPSSPDTTARATSPAAIPSATGKPKPTIPYDRQNF